MKEKNFIETQLFAEGENTGTGDKGEKSTESDKNPPTEKKENEKAPEPKEKKAESKVVSKDLFDKTASDLAKAKKALKDLERKDMTEEQKRADEIAEKEQRLKELTMQVNKANAISAISEAKAKVSLEKTEDIDTLISAIVSDEEDTTNKNATALSKLIVAIYEKGVSDTTKGIRKNTANGINVGNDGDGDGKGSSYGSRIAKLNKPSKNRDDITNIYK